MGLNRAAVILLAVGLDLLAGEPDERWHPVVWMGRVVSMLEKRAPDTGSAQQLIYGGGLVAFCLGAVALPAILAERLNRRLGLLGVLMAAVLLKPAFSVRALFQMGGDVQSTLERGDLEGARKAVGRIVSRDTTNLDEPLIAAAAIESVAENASDSVVAPFLAYSLFGLPGAYFYRMANTLDGMIGYRGPYEYLGKAAAKLDDLLNVIPSRLTALAIAESAGFGFGSPSGAWRSAIEDASRTPSPNAGWPMAAAAGALGVRLEKVGHYVLNPGGDLPVAEDIGRARRLVGAALALSVVASALLSTLTSLRKLPLPAGEGRGEGGSSRGTRRP